MNPEAESLAVMTRIAALAELDNVAATDWKLAGVEWIERRRAAFEARKARAMDDGV